MKKKGKSKKVVKSKLIDAGNVGDDLGNRSFTITRDTTTLTEEPVDLRSDQPAMWLYIRISDGRIFRFAAERIAEMMIDKSVPNVPTNEQLAEMMIDKSMHNIASIQAEIQTLTREIRVREVEELLHFPQVLLNWMTEQLKWNDVMLIAQQIYSSKIVDPADEWRTCTKGVLFEGSEI